MAVFVLFALWFVNPGRRPDIRVLNLILAALVLAGLVKYSLLARPVRNEYIGLLFNLADGVFVAGMIGYYIRLRRAGVLSYVLLTKVLFCLAGYVVVSDAASLLLINLWKLDVLVYASVFWLLALCYLAPAAVTAPPVPAAPEAKLEEGILQECLSALEDAFSGRKLYLDPELTLSSLAAELDIPSRTISVVLNRTVQKNFHEYLNEYRVAEAKQLLSDYRQRNSTIAAVAYEAGFNSLATFQRVFKKASGKTPREFAEN